MSLARFALAATASAALATLALTSIIHSRRLPPPHLTIRPERIIADGYDTASLFIEGRLRAGVLPARVRVRVDFAGAPSAQADLQTSLLSADSFSDGTPDFLRLDDDRDIQAFRRWFTWLAEAQYFQRPGERPPEISDCAALIRYAYREALHAHDSAWAASALLPMTPPFDSVAKYQYPFTPLGAALFRVRSGAFQPSDLADGRFAQFADVRTLWRLNTHRVSRVLASAVPGDLLFFRQNTGAERFHSMIYLGASLFQGDGKRYILYHTGPTGADPGEIRRLSAEELLRFPQSEWRPLENNPNF